MSTSQPPPEDPPPYGQQPGDEPPPPPASAPQPQYPQYPEYPDQGQPPPQQPPGWQQASPPPGHPAPPGTPAYASPPSSQKAVWSLVLGISALVSIPFCFGLFGLSIIASIAAIVLGAQAKGEIERSHGALGGAGQAQAGFITGIIGTVLLALGVLFFVGIFVAI